VANPFADLLRSKKKVDGRTSMSDTRIGRGDGADDPKLDRRTMLRGVAIGGASAAALAACGSDDDSSGSSSDSTGGSSESSEPSGGGGGGGGGGETLGPTSDVPVGGGVIYANGPVLDVTEQGVIVTQPSNGQFNGFQNVCAHAGCPLASVSDGTINCDCHGSQYALDGSVVTGPATAPLEPASVAVKGNEITLA
jgi:nitrite reductase/ring-hydroxylating ferredoxin subunit